MRKLSTLRDAATVALAVTPGCPEVTVHERRIHQPGRGRFHLYSLVDARLNEVITEGTKAQLLDWATRQRATWGCGR